MCAIDLVESPEQILCRTVDVVTARVVRKVIAERRPRKFRLEQIDLIEEKNDARPHEPAAVDDRVEEHQALHHAVLLRESVIDQRVILGVRTCELSSSRT